MDIGKLVKSSLTLAALAALTACTPKRTLPVNYELSPEQESFSEELHDRVYMEGIIAYSYNGESPEVIAEEVNKMILQDYGYSIMPFTPVDVLFQVGLENLDSLENGEIIEFPLYRPMNPLIEELIDTYVRTKTREDLFDETH